MPIIAPTTMRDYVGTEILPFGLPGRKDVVPYVKSKVFLYFFHRQQNKLPLE
jgi:hypothetical protein